MMMNLMTILVKKVFISSKPTFVYLLCPPLCGPFSIQESAAGGLSYKEKKTSTGCLFSVSLRARDVAERPGDVRLRRPQRSGDFRTVRARQGSNIQKRRYPTDISFFCIIESTRRDSNPRPSPWQGDTPPLSHSCKHTFKTTY